MASPLEGSLAQTIGKAFKNLFLDATLTRDVEAAVIPDPADPPAPTQASYACKAIVDTYSDRFRREGLVKDTDRKLLILATSLAVTPQPGDRITIRGATYTIMDVATDPALAAWECRGG